MHILVYLSVSIYLVERAGPSVLAFSLNTSSLIFLVQPTPTATQSILAAIHQGKGHCGLTYAARLVAPSGSEGSQTQAKDRRKVDKAHQHLHKE